MKINSEHFQIMPSPFGIFDYRLPDGEVLAVYPPIFEIDGEDVQAWINSWTPLGEPVLEDNGVTEESWLGTVAGHEGLTLTLTARYTPDSPILRFRYSLHSTTGQRLTKSQGRDRLTYLGWQHSPEDPATEIQLARFSQTQHSYRPLENAIPKHAYEHEQTAIGPILVTYRDQASFLAAYEHGSQVPDAFLQYHLQPDGDINLQAVRGNYYHGQSLETPYTTLWMQVAIIRQPLNVMRAHYRDFVLNHLNPQRASREPYIFYNTWNYQERLRHWQGGNYLDEMNEARMLAEIDAAHEIGIDVFVIDTGWYEKTGDWQVSQERFPNGLDAIRARLDSYGMKLGLWFNPTTAAVTSEMARSHRDCLKTIHDKPLSPNPIWLTEESQPYCLISRFGLDFADRLIELYRELGVTYFKWDGVDTYTWIDGKHLACDAPDHGHGDESVNPEERADCAAFQFPLALTAIAARVQAACPEAILDFDVTEASRAMGLAFLAAGKYFLINNGPYYHDYNMPYPSDGNWNMLFYPGTARPAICRAALDYDRWIPSILFLTHFFPDDPQANQLANLGTLILGSNGIWGDLPGISAQGRARIAGLLAAYKQVSADISAAIVERFGGNRSPPEVYEKINPENGRGVVVIYGSDFGEAVHITHAPVDPTWMASPGLTVNPLPDGRATLRFSASKDIPCGIVFFGARA